MAAHSESVFVYGTLRRGAAQHWRMDGAQFVRAGTIRARMYRFDWYPGLVVDETAGDVIGEIYQVSPPHLAALDTYEGLSAGEIQGSEYRRVQVLVHGSPAPQSAWVWEWLGPVDEATRITCGDWIKKPNA